VLLVLVRHGATIAGAGCCVGQADVSLSPEGAAEMAELARRWNLRQIAEPSRIIMSDLSRAVHSAAPFVERFGIEAERDARLREMSFGAWNGLDWNAIERDDALQFRRWAERWTELAPPGGETVANLSARARAFLDETRAAYAASDDTVLVVSHAGWIRAALAALFDEPASQLLTRPIDYARATIVQVDRTTTGLLAANSDTIG
jgi:broad specificity phosphatase PhoE